MTAADDDLDASTRGLVEEIGRRAVEPLRSIIASSPAGALRAGTAPVAVLHADGTLAVKVIELEHIPLAAMKEQARQIVRELGVPLVVGREGDTELYLTRIEPEALS